MGQSRITRELARGWLQALASLTLHALVECLCISQNLGREVLQIRLVEFRLADLLAGRKRNCKDSAVLMSASKA